MTPRRRLTLGIALIVLGVASSAVFLVLSLRSAFSSLVRVPAPGSQELRLDRGDYTVYWEIPGTGARIQAPDVSVGIRSSGGQEVAYRRGGLFVSRYSTFERRGVSVGSFSIAESGAYTVSASGAKDGSISMTRSLGFAGTLKLVLIPLVLMGGGVLAGVRTLTRKTPS